MLSQAVYFENVEFSYKKELPVLKIPRLEILLGEKVFLHGPSGSGKTTMLGLISGILRPQKGKVICLDQNLAELSQGACDHFRGANVGHIFQVFNLLPFLNVEENILLPLSLHQKLTERNHEDMRHLCSTLGLSNFLKKNVSELSVGQQQRVAAARAFIHRPRLIIADEPTSALDQDHKEKFVELLLSLEKSIGTPVTIVFVSHDKTLSHLFPRHISLAEINQLNPRK